MNGKIYMITNNLTGKSYIGQSCKNEKLFENYFGGGHYIRRSVKKYGKQNFSKIILKDKICCQTALDMYEIYFIRKYNTIIPHGYNISKGGDGGNLGPEVNKRISVALKALGRKMTEENKQRLIAINTGRKHTPEAIAKITAASTGRKMPEHMKINLSNARKGIIFSDEHKQNLSKSHIGHKRSKESVEKTRNANKIKMLTDANVARGTCWISNDELKLCSRIKKEKLEYYMKQGWIKKRTIAYEFINEPKMVAMLQSL